MQFVPNWPAACGTVAAVAFVAGLSLLAGSVVRPLHAAPLAAATPTAPPTAAAPPISDTTSATFKRTAVAGTTLKVNVFTAINPDCSPLPPYTVRISKPPVHGTMKVEAGEDFVAYPPGNPRADCNKQRVPGVLVSYTPDASYTGPDVFVIHAISPNGLVQNETFLITVE